MNNDFKVKNLSKEELNNINGGRIVYPWELVEAGAVILGVLAEDWIEGFKLGSREV
ncbi:bacteriocin [Tenacibaculum sp. ZH5_bin.1]|uniref:bacteriocin n=1 Tax=Tenacibaculum TaxID=104267 RepID=UPI0014317902|nr:bacteriocin [Tenacibaculum mesophilum]KAF9658012.1 bacteriocin [Tenacibaculum mesophilum]